MQNTKLELEKARSCYSCDHAYDAINPPGVCPKCGSQSTSPVGQVDVQRVSEERSGSTELYHAHVSDETDREVVYWIVVTEQTGRLANLRIADESLGPTSQQWDQVDEWLSTTEMEALAGPIPGVSRLQPAMAD